MSEERLELIAAGDAYRVLCEWDIGITDDLYDSEETAWAAAEQALIDCDIEDDLDELCDQRLISVEALTIFTTA